MSKDNRNCMIIEKIWDKEFNICPNLKCCNTSSQIPTFYSEKHALDSGWVKTKDPKFCEPTKNYVWVCPECVKEHKCAKIIQRD